MLIPIQWEQRNAFVFEEFSLNRQAVNIVAQTAPPCNFDVTNPSNHFAIVNLICGEGPITLFTVS